jgi:hypothetical protein
MQPSYGRDDDALSKRRMALREGRQEHSYSSSLISIFCESPFFLLFTRFKFIRHGLFYLAPLCLRQLIRSTVQ